MANPVASRRWLMLCAAVLTSWYDVTVAKCPWTDTTLLPWSSASSWEDNQVPGFEAEVVITKAIILDEQPPSLTSITVKPGAVLVWGNVNDITLNVTFILVEGEFHIGSPDCRFRKKATINLYGLSNGIEVPGFGRKFVGVKGGGKLEFHGLDKMSWTNLAHTVPAGLNLDCSLLYNFTDSPLSKEMKRGLYVMIWNSDGSVRDFSIFDSNTYDKLPQFLSGLPDGTVVAAAVKKSILSPPESALAALENIGAKSVRSVLNNKNYALVVKIGQKSSAQEFYLSDSFARLMDLSRGLEFRVASLAEGRVDFQVMSDEAAYPKITVQHDVSSWVVGDEILVTSTDFDWRQAEVKKIVACDDCAPNQIRLDSPFQYMHFGEVTMNVDERAEVALLTRNVKVQGQLEDECYATTGNGQWLCDTFNRDLFGGHVKAVMGATFHVQGVELYQMGQQHNQAAYPLHFHLMNNASSMYVRNNAIHHSLARCVTVHGTHFAEVSDNVCYLHLGHGYFLEDGVEQNNTFHRNLGVGTVHGALLLSDRHKDWCGDLSLYCDDLGTFWVTHPNNIFTNNVAGGSDGSGFFYVFADAPIGVSKDVPWILEKVPNNSVQYFPLKGFSDNVMHSNVKSGIFFDSKLSTGEMDGSVFVPPNGVLPGSPSYDPRDPPNASGTPVWTDMVRSTMYKNLRENAWVKGGNIRMVQSSFADANRGFTGGTIGENTGTMVKDSVFIGQTDNWGEPQRFTERALPGNPSVYFNHSYGKNPNESWTGISLYQGAMFVENCYFDRYGHYWWHDAWEALFNYRPVRPGAAISFQRHNIYPTKPWTHVTGIKFGYCDNVNDNNYVFKGNISTWRWGAEDGNKAHTFRDLDGSVTGQSQTQVVIDRPFYTGPDCVPRPNWHMTVCPYKYVQMEIWGNDGVLSRTNKLKSPLIVRRDDVPQDPINLKGTQKNEFLMRTSKSYTVNFNSTVSTVPTYFDIRSANIEKGDVIRVGLCLPKDTTDFKIRSNYPPITRSRPPVFATSLQQLDDDLSGRMFYWDNTVGMLYFKLMTNETRQNLTEECANGVCVGYKITRLDGSATTTDCSGYNNPPIADNLETPTAPQPKLCTGPDSPQGLGAVPSNVITASPFGIETCPQVDVVTGRSSPELRGCFKDKSLFPDLPYFETDLGEAMTQELCKNRCFYRGYQYAGLTYGKQCGCSDTFGLYGVLETSKCNTNCPGNIAETCGGRSRVQVFTTGLALKPVRTRCGPNDFGVVFDGQCVYVNHQQLKVGDAQRVCARLGGNLAAITSLEKQIAVEEYLRERIVSDKVWLGLNHARNPDVWEQRDASGLGGYNKWKAGHGIDTTKHFVYIVGTDNYQWLQTKDGTVAAPLCDIPLDTTVQAESCGFNNQGVKIGTSGTCYLVLHGKTSQETADYACRTARGTLGTFTNRDSEEELNHVLYRLGVDQDYWTAKPNKVQKWVNSTYINVKVTNKNVAGAICVLDTPESGNRCPADWNEFEGSCYLNLGTVVKSYSEGASLCESNYMNSFIVRVDSEAENTFLSTLVPSASTTTNTLLGLRYSSLKDSFILGNGNTPSYSPWVSGSGKNNLSAGSCAVLDRSSYGSWTNAPCDSLVANLVCELPVYSA